MHRNNFREQKKHGIPSFPIGVYKTHFEKNIEILAPLHYHNEFELFIAIKGNISVQIEENTYLLKEGEGLFINSGLLHLITATPDEDHSFIAIVFDSSIICSKHEAIYLKYISQLVNGHIVVNPVLSNEICLKLQNISQIFFTRAFGYELQIKQELTGIFHELIKDAPHSAAVTTNPRSQLIKTVLNYIDENYAGTITLQSMADSAHISKEYLCRIFSDMSDVSPIVYLNRYRIEQSTILLTDTDKSISEISTLCGFNNSSYFNKMFMRFIGCTPRKYRVCQGEDT